MDRFLILLSAASDPGSSLPALPEGGVSMWETITSGVGSFITGVVKPVADFCTQSEVPLAFLAVTFAALGVRMLRKTIGAFGRGR